jgi:2-keto-4-pentenoate hydratase/2-oxohepta-3-ene-1,7-dioic acid hydratase in catechol pathway
MKIICVGRNYREHAKELGNEVPSEPLIFFKPPSSILPDGESIVLPRRSARVEFEGEIGVVIGGKGRNVAERDAERLVSGIVAVNDVTARDLQKSDGQWTRAKGFDTFCPMGPVAPIDGHVGTLTVVTRVNGIERQRGDSTMMVFAIPTLIAFISSVMTLEPGDVIATGTPAGVGPLAPGDVVEVEIVGLSKVRNPVMAEA